MSSYETFQLVFVAIMAAVWGLSTIARRRPDIAWLQGVRNAFPQPTDEQRQKQRRRANVYAGAELILLGLIIPIGYLALTVMMFNDITMPMLLLVSAASLLCIGLGIAAIRSNRG